MTAGARAGPGLVRAASRAVVGFLFEPADTPGLVEAPPAATFPVVAVIGLAPRCGATTVARGLAAELALRSPTRRCPVEDGEPGPAMATVGGRGPLLLESGDPACGRAAAALADAVLLVASPASEPALAELLAGSLSPSAPEPLVVLARRPADPARWHGRCDVVLPQSRAGARAALAGRRPRGELGRAFRALADRVDP
jgi:hypothetical protein